MAGPRSRSPDFPASLRHGPRRTAFCPASPRSSSLPGWDQANVANHCRVFFMMALTKWFGVTESEAERCPAREKADIDEIALKSLLMQQNAATAQHRSLCRGTHASGVCVRAQFEIFDMTATRTPELAARLARGI